MIGGAVGGLVAGSDYKDMRSKGKSRGESLNASLHSTRNQRVVNEQTKKNIAKQVAGAPLRIATLPVGMLRDLSKGGLIQVGKNFMPRLKNVVTGDTLTNRADVKDKTINKMEQTDTQIKNNTNNNSKDGGVRNS